MKNLKNIMLVFTLIASLLVSPTKAIAEPTEIVSPTDMTIEGQINYYSELYDVDSGIINKVIQCESRGNVNAVGDGGRSRGIAQFQEPSFNRLSRLMGEELEYTSPHDQIKLMVWSIANGYGREWSAYRALMNGGIYSFYSSQLQKHFTVVCK